MGLKGLRLFRLSFLISVCTLLPALGLSQKVFAEEQSFPIESQVVPLHSSSHAWDFSDLKKKSKTCTPPAEFHFQSDGTQVHLENAYWLMRLSNLAYNAMPDSSQLKNEVQSLGFPKYQYFNVKKTGLQGFVAANDQFVFVIYRGSQEVADWINNLDFGLRNGPKYGFPGKIHTGFIKSLDSGWANIENIIGEFKDADQKIWVSGHSLGASLSVLTAARLEAAGTSVEGVYTFGQPRTGDEEFVEWLNAQMPGRIYRFVNDNDVVPKLPPPAIASREFSDALPNQIRGITEGVVRKLRYAHEGLLMAFDRDRILHGPLPTAESADKPYWVEFKRRSQGTNLITWILNNAELALDHFPGTYECYLRDAMQQGDVEKILPHLTKSAY
jgi:triacylglycerol lipase